MKKLKKNFKIKSYCKINLSLRLTKKLNNGYHNIMSLITFCGLHDIITITPINSPKDRISFSGRFKNGIQNRSNTITKTLDLLRKKNLINNQTFKINVKKNIPHGSGLGGASSNAAYLLSHFNLRYKLKLNWKTINKFANQIGFDVPIILERKNTFLTGKKNEMIRLKEKFKLNLLLVYPNLVCSTKEIYNKSRQKIISKPKTFFNIKGKKRLIYYLKKENNDLQKILFKIHPKIKKIVNFIKSQNGCYFSRITGSGSACIGIFDNMKNAIYAQKIIKAKYSKYWCIVSKTI